MAPLAFLVWRKGRTCSIERISCCTIRGAGHDVSFLPEMTAGVEGVTPSMAGQGRAGSFCSPEDAVWVRAANSSRSVSGHYQHGVSRQELPGKEGASLNLQFHAVGGVEEK